jgi:hypothetical protein
MKRAAAIILLTAAGLMAIGSQPVQNAYYSARGFWTHFCEIQPSTLQKGLWERVALSLVLTSAEPARPVCANRPPRRSASL